MLYFYKCNVIEVLDGDTVKLDVDRGGGIHDRDTDRGHRLWGINAPEIRTAAGKAAKRTLEDLLGRNFEGQFPNSLYLYSIRRGDADKRDKYGRYLAILLSKSDFDDIALLQDGVLDISRISKSLLDAERTKTLPTWSINRRMVDMQSAVERYY